MGGATPLELVRSYELRLIRCTFTSPPPQPQPQPPPLSQPEVLNNKNLHSHINEILNLIESGNYVQALSFSKLLLPYSAATHNFFAHTFYLDLVENMEAFLLEGSDENSDMASRVVFVICFAVAAFFCFIKINITGPLDEELPKCPVPRKVLEDAEFVEWEKWASTQLMSDGSHLLAKFSNLQYLVFAKMLVMRTRDLLFQGNISPVHGIRSISWWLTRLLFTQQRILDEQCSSLFDLLHVSMNETLHHFGTLEKLQSYWGYNLCDQEASTIISMIHLEAGMVEHIYGRVDSCRLHFDSAETAAGLQLSLTGVLGYRTLHQVEPRAQLVLVANTSSIDDGKFSTSSDGKLCDSDSVSAEDNIYPHECRASEFSDILMTPKLVENGDEHGNTVIGNRTGNPGTSGPLNGIQQAVVLAHCVLIEKSHRDDELQRWKMAPYIEAVDSQPSLVFSLRCFSNLLRIRSESTRTHTVVRALEMMRKLVEDIHEPLPGVAERVPFCYVAYNPTIPALQKEYGQLLVSCGLVGEAIKIFEDLELWDNLIYCNCLLGKKAAAVELIKKRLSERPNDPRLWCSLGDVTNNDSYYEKALEVSDDKSARAKRSLARSAYNRGDFETSKILWESAMALNSLYSDGWFALGAAALKARDVDKALEAFTRAVKLDPDNGEAWNNIACLHMIKKRSKEAFISFKEALKFRRDSWQMWENFSQVAVDVGNIRQALEAMKMVLKLTDGKRIDVESFEGVMQEIERRSSSQSTEITPSCECNASCPNDGNGPIDELESPVGGQRETEKLVELLGTLLQPIVKSESRADVWALYARWHKVRGDFTMCSEALLKQVRSYQGSDLWKDKERFKKFAHASLDLCMVYMKISSSTGSRRELSAAEMHLRNTVKQAECFSDTQEFRDLQACLDEVKLKLQAQSV
ncbi:hypothetical protein K2173_015427 [Erythroxylum novogranatense]|uniref:Tetratricopeptide repeat protein 27 homolog n=1 Tax=Erythroxylum novogranatense TaxID=1862640 RepID=A0AAV8SRP8_9ROSI|nr:hypothetical protein K2173_015427 [Erythroxylum novogranatense]